MKTPSLYLTALLIAFPPYLAENASAEDSFTTYDANRDGTVTYAELARGKKADFDKMDRNRDKVITSAEFRAPKAPANESYDLFATPAFQVIDADSDQMLSLSEFGKSVTAMINRCDTNADNAVSLEEYQKVVAEEKEKAAAAAAPKGSAPKGSTPKKGSAPKPPAAN